MEPVNLSARTSTHFWQVNKKKKKWRQTQGNVSFAVCPLSLCVQSSNTLNHHETDHPLWSSCFHILDCWSGRSFMKKISPWFKNPLQLGKGQPSQKGKVCGGKRLIKKETRSSFMTEKFKKSPAHKELSKICVEASVLHLSSSSCFSVSVLILNMLLKCIWILTPSWLDEVLIKYHMVQIDRPRIVPVIMLSTLWRHTTDARGKQDIRNVPLLIFTRETRVRRGFFLFLFYPPCPGKQSNLI